MDITDLPDGHGGLLHGAPSIAVPEGADELDAGPWWRLPVQGAEQ